MILANAYAYDGYFPRARPQVLSYGRGTETASRKDEIVQQAQAVIFMFLCLVPGGFIHMGIRGNTSKIVFKIGIIV
jgi:hypothetical protein